MADKSSIEWLAGGSTWNPIRARRKADGGIPGKIVPAGKVGWACVRISPGCENCYSEKQNVQCGTNPGRNGTGLKYTVPALQEVELFLDEETLMQPLHWKKGRLIFPCSMTDWMAEFVLDEWRDKMLAVMALTPQHMYLTLTKRADRQREYLNDADTHRRVRQLIIDLALQRPNPNKPIEVWATMPLPNHWVGVSAEDQPRADKRIGELLQTLATIRWVSAEPLLGPITFRWARWDHHQPHSRRVKQMPDVKRGSQVIAGCVDHLDGLRMLDWVVVGGESGAKARACNLEWMRAIVEQCKEARVACFVKQLGALPVMDEKVWRAGPGIRLLSANKSRKAPEGTVAIWMNDAKGGDIACFPKDLQVREYPRDRRTSRAIIGKDKTA